MLKRSLLWLSKSDLAKNIVSKFAWKLASRFVAGETLNDAISVIKELNSKGIYATLDHLGENTSTLEDANKATNNIIEIIKEIKHLNSNISIKLSQIGIDKPSRQTNLIKILNLLGKNFLRLDIEGSNLTDETFEIYKNVINLGYSTSQIGIAVQAYLYRTVDDIESFPKDTRIRLVKGAYNEPESIAFSIKADTDKSYDILAEKIILQSYFASTGQVPTIPAIATHDEKRIEFVKKVLKVNGTPKNYIEFQMLYGIRRDLQISLVNEGYPVRVYVPFGNSWYSYFMRRLAERPANLWFLLSNLLY